MADLGSIAAHQSAKPRHQARRNTLAIRRRRDNLPSKCRPVLKRIVQKLCGIRNQADSMRVARLGGIGPADHAVTSEDDALTAGMRRDVIAQSQSEIESRPLPRKPADFASPNLVACRLAAGGSRQSNH